jgi:chaperonin GroEL
MPHKQLLFHSEAREKVLRGATAIADAVRVTLGPKSRSVLIEKKWGKPIVCNDGVTIAKEFSLTDPGEDLGAQMLRGAAERTGDAVGDGTTTATLLAHAIVAEGMRNIAAGASAIDLKRGLDRAVRTVVEALRSQSRPVQSEREKLQVATISAHNDPAIGELVARAIEKVGAEGAVTVEEAKGTETTMDVVDGLQFDNGYLSAVVVDREHTTIVRDHWALVIHLTTFVPQRVRDPPHSDRRDTRGHPGTTRRSRSRPAP